MNINLRILSIGSFLISLTLVGPYSAFSADTIIRAKIGIQVNSNTKPELAKSRDRLRAGDTLRIYVVPEETSYIYVIYSDKKEVVLLKKVEPSAQKMTIILPSASECFRIDGKSSHELFTIICSPVEIDEISRFLSSEKSYEKWAIIEDDLAEKSEIDLLERSDIPFSIAGNVRSVTSDKNQQSLISKLKIFSGNSLVIKKYEFSIKK